MPTKAKTARAITPRTPKAAKQAKPEAAKPAVAVAPVTAPEAATPAKPAAHIARTAATIVRNATNFGGLSDRDNAYMRFYAGIAKRNGGTVTLAAIVETGQRPSYDGSNKPHDAGVINRLGKAGLVARSADGHSFTFTDKAKSLAAYTAA